MLNFTSKKVFKFERKRLGYKTTTTHYEKFGPYLYRNTITNQLIASWDQPTNEPNYLYKGEDIGYNTDALIYYKNY